MLARIKKNDTVVVLTGKDRGKQGLVITVYPKKDVALVKDVCVVSRHTKPKRQGQKGDIVKEERPIPLAKVMPICPACKKPCRIRVKMLEGKNKVRVCNHCEEAF
jgi:large subunit ribosomal protein L24